VEVGPALLSRVLQAHASAGPPDGTLVRDVESAIRANPHVAELHHLLGLALLATHRGPDTAGAVTTVAAERFRRAIALQPGHWLARLNLAETLATAGQKDAADVEAVQALLALERDGTADALWLDAVPARTDYGVLRMEWEKAAWEHAGQPAREAQAKRQLLRWRLHGLRGQLTGEIRHAYDAALARPDLPSGRGTLGCTLMSAGHRVEALPQLRRALEDNPLDREAARALFAALSAVGDNAGRDALVRERRLLQAAAPALVPFEPWFSEPRPVDNALASLIILCCNEIEVTRLCLESVLRHTRAPYELVLVDNASTDGTPAYLEELRSRAGPARVEIIRNETNRGFPAGCNQAIAHARGRYLVFQNNDVVVTEGWLEGLLRPLLQDWPAVGMVGPVTSAAPAPQGIPIAYSDLPSLDAFAANRRREFAGRTLACHRITGFCLLARPEVLARIGGFDEDFALGFFEDDDLCVRTREAGYRLVVALDVFVHHFGSRTFHGLGIETGPQLSENLERFRAKWGAEAAAGYRLTEPLSLPAAAPLLPAALAGTLPATSGPKTAAVSHPGSPVRVSLTMIVKNEEATLPNCLSTAGDLFDEVIVVDTGSTDGTREAAARFGARLFDFPWVDSFAAARNEALRHARGRWVMWLDADDILDEENRQRLRSVLAGLGDEPDAYAMKVRSALDTSGHAFRLLDQVRLFPNRAEVRWQYRVHEQILPSARRLGGGVRWADVIIDHTGYQRAEARHGKLERNLRLLQLDYADAPQDAFTLFNLGWTTLDLGRTEEAAGYLRRSLEASAADSSIMRKLYDLLCQAHRHLDRADDALSWCEQGMKLFPDDPELLLQKATLLRQRGDRDSARSCLWQLLENRPGQYFASVDAGLRGYKTRHLLAELYREDGRTSEAEVQWRHAVTEKPNFAAGWIGLGEMFLQEGRWAELDAIAGGLEREAGDAVDARILQARACFARKEYLLARTLLETVIARAPKLLAPRVLLTHVLLQQGQDRLAAEKALRAVLELDPAHKEAQHNLDLLLRHQGRRSA
jgi:GT2 family glycosyltransferase/predicted Zn-dependent protease